MKKTNVIRLLEQQKISYQLFEYEYHPDYLSAKAIAISNGLHIDMVYKTLVGKGNKTGILVAVIPSQANLDFKKLSKASGNKKMALVPVKDLLSLTGYIRGGCSPMGMKKDYPVFLDAGMFKKELIYVNAGQRGLLVGLSPHDLLKATKGEMTDLVATDEGSI